MPERPTIRDRVSKANKQAQNRHALLQKQPHISPQPHAIGENIGRDGSISMRMINGEPFFTGKVKGKWYYRKMLASAQDVAGEIDTYVTTVKNLVVTNPLGIDHDSLGGVIDAVGHDGRYYTKDELLADGVLDWNPGDQTGRYYTQGQAEAIHDALTDLINDSLGSLHDPPSGGDGIDVTDIGAFNEVSVDLVNSTSGLWIDTAKLRIKNHTAVATKLLRNADGLGIDSAIEPTWEGEHEYGVGSDYISSSHWVWDSVGWKMTRGGSLDVRYINADELHVKAFIADLEQALANGQIIAKSVVILAEDFTTATGTVNVTVEGIPGFLSMNTFAQNDYIRVRTVNRTVYENTDIKGLDVHDTWYKVLDVNPLSNIDGIQIWRLSFQYSKSGQVGYLANKGGVIIDYGQSGDGFYQVTAAKETGDFDTVPFARLATWMTNPWTPGNIITRAKMGNLKAETSIKEWGFYFYKSSKIWGKLGSTGGQLHGVDFRLYDNLNERIRISAGVSNREPSIKIGTGTLDNMDYGTVDGIFIGKDSGTYKFRVGDPADAYFGYDGLDVVFQTAGSGQRIVLDGNTNSLNFYEAGGDLAIRLTENAYGNVDGLAFYKEGVIHMSKGGQVRIHSEDGVVAQTVMLADSSGGRIVLYQPGDTGIFTDLKSDRILIPGFLDADEYITTSGYWNMEYKSVMPRKQVIMGGAGLNCLYLSNRRLILVDNVSSDADIYRIATHASGGSGAPSDGQEVFIQGLSTTYNIIFRHGGSSSSDEKGIYTETGADVTIDEKRIIHFVYSDYRAKWLMVGN